jgi:hypothetical protein
LAHWLLAVSPADFNGQQASARGDGNVHSTSAEEGLVLSFFADPARFHPNTIIFGLAWRSRFKKDILDGDSKRQIESIWLPKTASGPRTDRPIAKARTA